MTEAAPRNTPVGGKNPAVSAYVPCYNNPTSLGDAVASLRSQSMALEEIFIVDDGSNPATLAVADSLGVPVFRHHKNMGRGAVRARAMTEASGELVLCCDATNVIAPDFLAAALPWFNDPQVAAVFGRLVQGPAHNAAERWRGRHLFKMGGSEEVQRRALLVTSGAVVRKSAVMAVGNYLPALAHTEDAELGRRLLESGYDVVFDPALKVLANQRESLGRVMERYWRWNAGESEQMSIADYLRQIGYALKVMVREDLRRGDPLCALFSFLSPHFQFWYAWSRRRTGIAQQKPL